MEETRGKDMNIDLEIQKHKAEIKSLRKIKRLQRIRYRMETQVYRRPVVDVFDDWIYSFFSMMKELVAKEDK